MKYLARRHLAVDPKTTGGGTTALPPLASVYKHLPVVDFDPVENYIKELEVRDCKFGVCVIKLSYIAGL